MQNNKHLVGAILLMMVAALSRFIPHLPNFTPTEALALFGSAYLGKKYWAVLVPVVMLYCSDFVINNTVARSFFPNQEGLIYFSPYMIFNVVAIVAIVALGSFTLKKISVISVMGSALISSILFFIITNFGVWAEGILPYTRDFSGLLSAYAAGLPFLRNTLLSNLVFTAVLFGSYAIVTKYYYSSHQGTSSI